MIYYNDKTLVFHNGEFKKATEVSINPYSQALHYGIGVFEGLRSYATPSGVRTFKTKAHYERLLHSANKMNLSVPYTAEQLAKLTYELLEMNKLDNAYIRPIIYADVNMGLQVQDQAHIFIAAWEWKRSLAAETPIKVHISSFERPNPRSCFVEAKVCGHYTTAVLAAMEAEKNGCHEALLLDSYGHVAQAPGGNFFYERKGKLYTPPAGNIFPGFTRKEVMQLAKQLDIEVIEKITTPKDIFKADGAFLTGTSLEVTGIECINDYEFPMKWENTIGYEIQRMYRKRVTRARHSHFALM